jgi:hypothetical protein
MILARFANCISSKNGMIYSPGDHDMQPWGQVQNQEFSEFERAFSWTTRTLIL